MHRLVRYYLWSLVMFALVACSPSNNDAGPLVAAQAAAGTAQGDRAPQPSVPDAGPPERVLLAAMEGARLEMEAGLYILHVSGSPYEMGYQHGTLLKDQIRENIASVTAELLGGGDLDEAARAVLNELGPVLLGLVGEIMEPFIPNIYRQEMHGVCDASDVPYLKMVGLHTFLDTTDYLASLAMRLEGLPPRFDSDLALGLIAGFADVFSDVPAPLRTFLLAQSPATVKILGALSPGGCTIFGAWGDATADGSTIFARVLDFPWMPTLMKNSVLTLYRPATPGSIPFASLGWAGYIGGLTGMNAAGLTFGETTLTGRSATILGVPFFLLCRQVMQFCPTQAAALELVANSPRTTGYSMLIMDPDSGGVVVEESGGALWGVLMCGNLNGPFFTRRENPPPQAHDPAYDDYHIAAVAQTLVTSNCALTDYRHISWPVNARYARIMQGFQQNLTKYGHAFDLDRAKAMMTSRIGLDGKTGGEGHIFRRDNDPVDHGTLQAAAFAADSREIWVDADHSKEHAAPVWVQVDLDDEFNPGK